MKDSIAAAEAMAAALPGVALKPRPPEAEQQLKCPRCDSTNTKFCYYNNYNLAQPRHFCKDCRRYWTVGGALRDVPIGGGSRKNSKRSAAAAAAATTSPSAASKHHKRQSTSCDGPDQVHEPEPISLIYPSVDQDDGRLLNFTGSFSSLLSSDGTIRTLLHDFQPGGMAHPLFSSGGMRTELLQHQQQHQSSSDSNGTENVVPVPENLLGLMQGDCSYWTTSGGGSVGGWPDLSIFTPGSSFQ